MHLKRNFKDHETVKDNEGILVFFLFRICTAFLSSFYVVFNLPEIKRI